MQTRSQTNYEKNALYEVDIDFDEASKLWKSNKKSIGNGCYKYIDIKNVEKSEKKSRRKPKK